MPIEATVKGNAAIVIKSLAGLEDRLFNAAERGLRRGLERAVTVAQTEFLQGPRPARLGERTGRLLRSVTSKVIRTTDRIRGTAGTNVPYGAFHEFGFHGVQNVKAHTRVIQQFTGSGFDLGLRKEIRDKAGNFVGFKESRKRQASRQTTGLVVVEFVKAHTRRIDYAGRPFIRPALAKTEPLILGEILKEMKAA